VQVDSGLFESDARRINEAFIHWIQNARPFGVLKVAMSLDGKIATASGESQWITSEESRRRGHLIRHSADALLTGSGTILQDDPLLTDRSGKQRRRPLIRAVIDRRGRLNLNHRIFSFPGVLLYTDIPHFELPPDHEVIRGRSALSEVVADLADRDVQTLMLECGPDMAFEAIRHGVIDKIVVFVSPQIIGGREIPAFGSEGARALSDAIGIENWDVERVGPDLMITGYVHRDN
jgi:diaminohydroxyphosphoribosylaminopyrimidine deaminase/5-amino-6-(5-phosphoribosylamino)uracil reductase